MQQIHPIRLKASLHETIWGGRRLEQTGLKELPVSAVAIGEAWETEISTVAQNPPYTGKTLGELVSELGEQLLGNNAMAIFGPRFPLLAKFIDANTRLSVQVHPDDLYAAEHEHGKLGKTEFWYILDTAPGASIMHGFQKTTTRSAVQEAIAHVSLEELIHEEPVAPGDVVFVPAGTVHAIGGGILLYELQEYSDVTYRMYDYGRRDSRGELRELHVERSLDVSMFEPSVHRKMQPVVLVDTPAYMDRCLVACCYFVSRELVLRSGMAGETSGSCIILSSLEADVTVRYGHELAYSESLTRGQTVVLPAALGRFLLEGQGSCLYSYVPASDDAAWRLWLEQNEQV